MNIIPHKTPQLLKWLYPGLYWNIQTDEKKIFITFDDGPVPDVTPFVLDTLRMFQAKATFFCVGDNIQKYPSIYHQLTEEGHSVGNHTYNHLKGWETKTEDYLINIEKCEDLLGANSRKLFRPPYGRITRRQIESLSKNYKIIMWDVLSADYERGVSEESCLKFSLKHSAPGSIVLFHDHYKTYEKLKFVLPRYLDHLMNAGYVFEPIQIE